MAESILDRTGNLFDLYRHVCGESEVPPVYNFWSCVAGISAALSDHCWVELIRNIPLKPNLFIGFIGPGSLGKGIAMSNIADLVKDSIGDDLKTYRGKVTAPHLVDVLGKPYKVKGVKHLANPRCWLIMDELKNGVGSNKILTEEFIALMTEVYTGSHYPIQTGTRQHGQVTIDKSCVSWLFGSNEAWLRQVLSKDIFESGFVARCCFVKANYDIDHRVFEPIYPDDHEEVYDHLRSRFWALHQGYKGCFNILPRAKEALEKWYYGRPAPEDEMLYSVWYRQKELVMRFALIQCVADGGTMDIDKPHVTKAVAMVNQIFSFAERLIESAAETFESKITNEVAKVLRKQVAMKHCDLLKYLNSRRGYTRKRVVDAVTELKESNLIETKRSPTGGLVYIWRK